MRKVYMYTLQILYIFLLLTATAWSATYFVSPNGNNTTGGSWANAWNGLDSVNANVAGGDTIWFGTGRYRGPLNPPLDFGGSTADRTVFACSAFVATGVQIWNSDSTTTWTQYAGNVYYHNYPTGRTVGIHNVAQGDSLFWIETALVNVDAPGEYYYDATDSNLYVYVHNIGAAGYDPDAYDMEVNMDNQVSTVAMHDGSGYTTLYGLEIRFGGNVISVAHDASGGGRMPDSVHIIHCHLRDAGRNAGGSNPALIQVSVVASSESLSWRPDGLLVQACSLGNVKQAGKFNTSGHGCAITFYTPATAVVESCTFYGSYSAHMIQFKNQINGNLAENNVIRFNTFKPREEGAHGIEMWHHHFNDSIYGNIFNGDGTNFGTDVTNQGAIEFRGSDDSVGFGYYVYNNTFYNYPRAILSGLDATNYQYDKNIMYNVVYSDSSGGYYLDIPAVDTSNFAWDSNFVYIPNKSTMCRVGGTDRNFTAWQDTLGYDLNSSNGVDPAFNAAGSGDFSRPAASGEMNQTYGGKTWTIYGAVQNAAASSSPRFIPVRK